MGLVCKRLFDITFSLAALSLFSPLFVIIGLLIKLDSAGPVFYRGVRVGKLEKHFKMWKFRTMIHSADRVGGTTTPEDDTRLTGIGRSLRKFKLDELPQLFNVLRGEMSLAGPRPQVPWAVELYTEEEKALLTVRPGMTDFASLRFRNEGEMLKGSKDPDRDYLEKIHPEKVRLGLEYVRTRSLWVDVKIICLTVLAVLGVDGWRPRGTR